MSIKAIEAIEEFVRKRDFTEGPSIAEIKQKIEETVRCRRNDAYDILMEGRTIKNATRKTAISRGLTYERIKI